jgi:hypothetical protein
MTAKLLSDQVLPRWDLAVAHAGVFPVQPEVCYRMACGLEWVRNVRAAGGRVVLGRRGQRRGDPRRGASARDRAPVIRAYLLRAGRRPGSAQVAREARDYLEVSSDPTLAELGSVADRYPVFRVMPRPNRARPQDGMERGGRTCEASRTAPRP